MRGKEIWHLSPKMTVGQATTFDRYSLHNASQAMRQLQASGACKGSCLAYDDMFTYARWQAQGHQVRKGEHGARLCTFIRHAVDDGNGVQTRSRPWITFVFCRCQVD